VKFTPVIAKRISLGLFSVQLGRSLFHWSGAYFTGALPFQKKVFKKLHQLGEGGAFLRLFNAPEGKFR